MSSSTHTEASKLLEAALEQMDGIIQGAKYEIPGFFDQETTSSSRGGTSLSPSKAQSIPDALMSLKYAIANNPDSSSSRIYSQIDKETQDFLFNWLKNNQTFTSARPRHLGNMSSSSPQSTPDDMSPVSRKGVAFSDKEEEITTNNDSDLDTSYASNRPPRGFKKIFGKIKRSNSGGHLEEHRAGSRPETPEFRRGGFRATAGGRIGWAQNERTLMRKQPFGEWNVDMLGTWLECLGLGLYTPEVQKHVINGEQLAQMTHIDLEAKLGIRNALHRKKLTLAMSARQDPNRPDREGNLDSQWVLRWLDDVGLPQYKDSFSEAKIDGRVLNLLTIDDLFLLKVTNQLHHYSLKRGIQVLRESAFEADGLKRRAVPGESISMADVARWTNHRVMEWLKEVDLAEYVPNLRGSGVHGALMVYEPRFNDELLASLLSIPPNKTLLRRHLSIHFKDLVGKEVMQLKRNCEQDSSYVPLTPTAKAKSRPGQFTLKRKKSKSQFAEAEEFVCPFTKEA